MSLDSNVALKILTDNSGDLIVRCRPNGEVAYVSPSSLRLFGWTPESLIGTGTDHLIHPEDLHIVNEALARSRLKDVEDIRVSFRVRRKDNSWVWMESVAYTIRDSITGELGDIVVIARDITETKALEDRLNALAMTDGLTGLANRRAFDEGLDREWRRTLREGTQLSL